MRKYFEDIKTHPKTDITDLQLIDRLLPRAKTILDIGSGDGSFLHLVSIINKTRRVHYTACGIDSNADSVLYSKKRGLDVLLGDGQKTKFKRNSFDVVHAKDILEHLDKPDLLVQEAYRLLTTGGLFIIHTSSQYSPFYPIVNFWDDFTHIRPFTKKALKRLLETNGFEVLKIEGYTLGRNWLENILCTLFGFVFPFEWRVVAIKFKIQNPKFQENSLRLSFDKLRMA